MDQGKFLVRAAEISGETSRYSHPWNPDSEIFGVRLSSLVGPSRVGVSLTRVPAVKEPFAYHSHHREEEW